MKARVSRYVPLCVLIMAACGPTTSHSPADTITFDAAKRLDDFEFATAGDGRPGEWLIIDNDAGRALAPIDTQATENRLSFAIYQPFSGRDVHASTRFMTLSGKIDQTAGIFVRFRSVDDYYAVGANAIENNVNLYRVVAGKREMIGCMEINVSGQAWHTLVSRRETTASRYFSMAGSFLSRPTEGFRALPAKLVCGPRPTAWPCSKLSQSDLSIDGWILERAVVRRHRSCAAPDRDLARTLTPD